MIKPLNKNFLVLLFVFISASIFRCIFNQSEYINNIIALVNVISLIYVRFLIIDVTKEYLKSLLDEAEYLGDKVKERKIKYFIKKSNLYSIFIIIFGILYVFLLENAIINDIIGFMTLFMSIESNYIAELSGKRIFKKK